MSEETENTPKQTAEGVTSEDGTAAVESPALTRVLKDNFGDAVLSHHAQHGDETVVVTREKMKDILAFLKNDHRCAFEMMVDLTAVDHLPRKPRFEVVIHLKSLTLNHRLRVKIPVDEESPEVDSILDLWVASDWYERECHEMYGIRFKGHPNLAPLLLYEGFQGFPLRKDYEKGLSQPLVELRPVSERYSYGETFQPVTPPKQN